LPVHPYILVSGYAGVASVVGWDGIPIFFFNLDRASVVPIVAPVFPAIVVSPAGGDVGRAG